MAEQRHLCSSAPDPLPTGKEMGLEFTSDDFLALIDEMTFEELKDACDELGATLALLHWVAAALRCQGSEPHHSSLLCL